MIHCTLFLPTTERMLKKEKINVIIMSSRLVDIYMSCSGVFVVNFEHISQFFLLILLLTSTGDLAGNIRDHFRSIL